MRDSVNVFSLGRKNHTSTTNLRNMPIANPCIAFVKVNVLDEDTVVMNLEFSVQETTCLRDSGDPSSCTFRRGYYVVSDPGSNVRETLTTSASCSLRSRCNLQYALYPHTVRMLCIRWRSDAKRPTEKRSPSTSETLLDMDMRP